MANRHQQRKAATRQAILAAARDVIIEKGYSHVDILDITERANVSKATFYKHFANKEDCVRQLMHTGFDALAEDIFRGGRVAASREVWVRQSLERVLNWAAEHREFMLIMVGGAASSQLNTFGRQYMVDLVGRTIDEFEPGAHVSPYPRDIRAQVITGILIQTLGWWLESDTGYSAAALAQIIQEIVNRGLEYPTRSETPIDADSEGRL